MRRDITDQNGLGREMRGVALRSILVPKASPAKRSEKGYGDENDSGKCFFPSHPSPFFSHTAFLCPCSR